MSFNNRVPGDWLNCTVKNLLLVGMISENPSTSRCVSAQWGERGVESKKEEEKKWGEEERELGKMRDVAFNDCSPPASWHAEFVPVCVREAEQVRKCVCTRMCRPVVDNVCLSAHSSCTEQNNPPWKSSNTTLGVPGWWAQQETFPSKP